MKLDTIVKITAILHHLVWSIVGILVLAGIAFFVTTGYKALLSAAGATSQAKPAASTQPQLSDTEVKCIEDALGKKRFDEITSSASATPSPDEQAKIAKCFPGTK